MSAVKQKILIVDDEPDILELIEYNLKKEGYQVFLANNGQEVLEMLEKEEYEVILMDIQMPILDGLSATRKIRTEFNKQPVIIAMTANAMVEDKEECLSAGMNDYVSKPINMEELVRVLKETSLAK